jgi:hypothetical protein
MVKKERFARDAQHPCLRRAWGGKKRIPRRRRAPPPHPKSVIPWEWSLYFTATSCELSDSIEISQPLNFKFKVTNQDGTVTEQKSSD